VYAHHADAAVIRGDAAGPPPDLAAWERPIYDQVRAHLPAGPVRPVRVDRELADGDVIDGIAGGALTVAVPGHTAGSIALYLRRPRVLFTGDVMARDPQSRDPETPVIPGVFNVDRAAAFASFTRLATLDARIACFGHGEPIVEDATARMRAALARGADGAGPRS
jgi:glyoxylase-like metal-dependent hydrolase (beta-lactamase superfamily II)